MPRKTLHICDRCKHEQENLPPGKGTEEEHEAFSRGEFRFFYEIGITLDAERMRYIDNGLTTFKPIQHQQYWCGQCCAEVGLRKPQHNEPSPKLPVAPTLENMVREIAETAVRNALAEKET